MGQSASAYEDDFDDDSVSGGSYYSDDEEGDSRGEYSDDEEGYESEGSSVGLNDDGNADLEVEKKGERQCEDPDGDPQQPPPDGPVALEDLSGPEILERIDDLGGISRHDLISASRAIRSGYHPEASDHAAVVSSAVSSGSTKALPSPSRGFYVDDGHYAADVKVAMRVLAASEDVRLLRFKLVPARMKEPLFWSALLGILRCGKLWVRIAEEERTAGKNCGESKANGDSRNSNQCNNHAGSEPVPTHHHHNGGTESTVDAESSALKKHIQRKDAEVSQLRRALEASKSKIELLEKQVAEMRSQQQCPAPANQMPTPSTASAKASKTTQPHKGTWVMDRDSEDFLALDEELKANLRAEKAKRLKEVRHQMRFILDSDDIALSQGSWSCCGSKEYGAKGCGS